jgi:hypothetical protein
MWTKYMTDMLSPAIDVVDAALGSHFKRLLPNKRHWGDWPSRAPRPKGSMFRLVPKKVKFRVYVIHKGVPRRLAPNIPAICDGATSRRSWKA